MSEALGVHLLLDVAEAPFSTLDDTALLESALRQAVDEMGANLLGVHIHRLSPQGLSGIAVISESHLTVHTWPELGEAAADLFTCGDASRARSAIRNLAARLGGTSDIREVPRGMRRSSQNLRRTAL